jgi:hypothetical protein
MPGIGSTLEGVARKVGALRHECSCQGFVGTPLWR